MGRGRRTVRNEALICPSWERLSICQTYSVSNDGSNDRQVDRSAAVADRTIGLIMTAFRASRWRLNDNRHVAVRQFVSGIIDDHQPQDIDPRLAEQARRINRA